MPDKGEKETKGTKAVRSSKTGRLTESTKAKKGPRTVIRESTPKKKKK